MKRLAESPTVPRRLWQWNIARFNSNVFLERKASATNSTGDDSWGSEKIVIHSFCESREQCPKCLVQGVFHGWWSSCNGGGTKHYEITEPKWADSRGKRLRYKNDRLDYFVLRWFIYLYRGLRWRLLWMRSRESVMLFPVEWTGLSYEYIFIYLNVWLENVLNVGSHRCVLVLSEWRCWCFWGLFCIERHWENIGLSMFVSSR